MTIRKISAPLFATMLLFLSGMVCAADAPSYMAPETEMQGTIEALDFGANTMIFEGMRFHMAPDLQVEIRGSYGAFTMLTVGMKAVVTYRMISGSERHAVRIVQLPDNALVEEA